MAMQVDSLNSASLRRARKAYLEDGVSLDEAMEVGRADELHAAPITGGAAKYLMGHPGPARKGDSASQYGPSSSSSFGVRSRMSSPSLSRAPSPSPRDSSLPASTCVLRPEAATSFEFLDKELQRLLVAHRLEQYAHSFFEHRVDYGILPHLTLADLIEMGLPLHACRTVASIKWSGSPSRLRAAPRPRKAKHRRSTSLRRQ